MLVWQQLNETIIATFCFEQQNSILLLRLKLDFMFYLNTIRLLISEDAERKESVELLFVPLFNE